MPPSIELDVRALTKRYSPQVSVGPISFEAQEGEFFSLLGPSGCGKTTTLRCIAGFEALTEGSIRLHGERLDDKLQHAADPVGDRRFAEPAQTQPERDVVEHRQMRKQCVILENKADVAAVRRLLVKPLTMQAD